MTPSIFTPGREEVASSPWDLVMVLERERPCIILAEGGKAIFKSNKKNHLVNNIFTEYRKSSDEI